MLKPGLLATFVMYLVFLAAPFVYTFLGMKGRKFVLKKRIAAMEAIPEGVARAAELGGICVGTTGGSSTETWRGPQVIAGLTLLGHVARLAIRNNVPFYISAREPEQSMLAEDVLKTAYSAEGKPELFKTEYNLWFGREPSYEAGLMAFMATQKTASVFYLGGFGSDAILLGEAGAEMGAMQIGASPNTFGVVFLVATCDYVMLGDELFAGAAMITENPVETGSLVGADVLRGLVMVLTFIGVILATAGIPYLTSILKT